MTRIDTPAAFAKTFKAGFESAVRDAAGSDGRLAQSEAKKIAEPYRDNAVNFLEKTGQKSVSVDKLIGRAHDYALATASKAAGPDGRLSAVDIRALPADLHIEAGMLLAPSAAARAKELRGLADKISLHVFGEDDSGASVRFVRRKTEVDELTSDTFLKAFGFSREKQEASDQYSFEPMTARGWDDLIEAQYDDAGKRAMERVREVMEPLGAKIAFLEDDRPFGAPVFLVARGVEGELFGFRATVGGMGF
jgi:hypothetical protein